MSHAFIPMMAPTIEGVQERCGYLYKKDGQLFYCLAPRKDICHESAELMESLAALRSEVNR